MTNTAITRLDDLVPSPEVAARYVSRLVGGYSEFATYEAALASGHNVLVEGPTGTGKTMSYRAFAATKGLPFYRAVLSQDLDFGVLLGSYQPTADGSLVWVDGILTQMVREGRGVFLFDEVNAGGERQLTRFYGLWDEARELVLKEHAGEVLRIQPGAEVLIVAAYNRGYRGMRELSEALPNRFAFKMRFDYDPDVESQLVPSQGLLEAAGKLRAMPRQVTSPVSTNMLIEFCEIAMAFDVDYALANFSEAFGASGERDSVAQVMGLYRDRIDTEVAAAAAALDEEGI